MKFTKFHKPTGELLQMLKESNSVNQYMAENQDEFINIDIAEYLEKIIQEKQLKRADIVKESGLDRSYV